MVTIGTMGIGSVCGRALSLIAIAATLVAVGAGCDPRALRYASGAGAAGTSGAGGEGDRATYELVPAPVRKLDIVFVVDTSQEMSSIQVKLAAQIPVFMNVLKMVPSGGSGLVLPSLHAAVVSADTGAGAFDLPGQGCPLRGGRGQFRTNGRTACPGAGLDPTQPLHYLTAYDNERDKNYSGDIGKALSCLALLGEDGCFVSSPLEAVRWALDPMNPPAGHQGFLRSDALLAIIVVGRQDDCSLPDSSTLFDPNPSYDSLASPLGPFTGFRCNEFGDWCTVGTASLPPSVVPTQVPVDCEASQLPSNRLTQISDEVAFLKGLKSDPTRVFVAAIAGPATPYVTTRVAHTEPTGVIEMIPALAPSCTANAGESGLPAVRLQQWVQGFGNHGLVQTICAPTFAPAFTQVAQALSQLDLPQCLGAVRDANPATPEIDADCVVTDQVPSATGGTASMPLPECAGADTPRPCWSVNANAACDHGLGLFIDRAFDAPAGTTTTASCQICPPGAQLSGCP